MQQKKIFLKSKQKNPKSLSVAFGRVSKVGGIILMGVG